MLKKILSRLAQMLVTVIGVSFLTFCLTYLAPGDPALMLLEAGDGKAGGGLCRHVAAGRGDCGADFADFYSFGDIFRSASE